MTVEGKEKSVTDYASPKEENRDGQVFHILSGPGSSPAAKVLHEDVGSTIEEDQEALNKLGRRTPFLRLLRANVPCPAKLAKASSPTTQSEDAQPEEDTALNPVRQTVEDFLALLVAFR
ncbi:hypothetical protein HG530_015492 [Fusarium avenaceum]|nr:hypothetical protein HG530_015492 [Fusarium avenaceum]